MSQIVKHKDVVYISGQVDRYLSESIADQTTQTLIKIDELLKIADTKKANLITA